MPADDVRQVAGSTLGVVGRTHLVRLRTVVPDDSAEARDDLRPGMRAATQRSSEC